MKNFANIACISMGFRYCMCDESEVDLDETCDGWTADCSEDEEVF